MEPIPYRFYLTGRSGSREAFPKNGNALAIKWQQENNNAYLRKQLTGKLQFQGEDFAFLYFLEKSIYRCEAVELRIDRYCGAGYQPYQYCRLVFSKGEWNLNSQTVNIEPTVVDLYTCFSENADVSFNLLNYIGNKITVSSVRGDIETVYCNSNSGVEWCQAGDPYSQGYTIVAYYSQSDDLQNTGPTPGPDTGGNSSTTNVQVTWAREVVNLSAGETLPAPWVLTVPGGSQYAKPPALFNYRSGSYGQGSFYYIYDYSASFDNGLKLKDIFQMFLNQACYGYNLKSNFFQWNPDTISSINYATGETTKVSNLILFQKSDIKRPYADNNATIAEISFSDLLKDICNIFNLEWWVDEASNFNIEHVSFKNQTVGIDARVRSDKFLRAGKDAYTYEVDDLPRIERFTWMDKVYNDFGGRDIIYNSDCAGLGNSSINEITVTNITTDVEYILLNGSSDNNSVSEDGFVLIACDENNGILSEAPILGGYSLNNTLAWSRLHLDYWRDKRPFYQFNMNGQSNTAKSVKPTKKQSGLIFKMCCDDNFNPDLLITTNLGNGIVDEPTLDIYTGTLTLNLLFEADIDLINNENPVAVEDNVETFQSLPIIIDVLGNDTDDGTIQPQTLEIVLSPSHGTAEITPDYKIKFTPANGYTGTDIMLYRVKDELNAVSNNGVINVLVKAGSPLPVANADSYTVANNAVLTVNGNGLLVNDTGDGTITAIAENKATAAGGSVSIDSFGNFTYTPPANYVGNDTFTYTMKDANNNQATGTVTINVFAPQPVTVSLVSSNQNNEQLIVDCDGQQTLAGSQITKDFALLFNRDITGYNLTVNVRYTYNYSDGSTNTYVANVFINSGNQYQYLTGFITHKQYMGCDSVSGNPEDNYDVTLNLEPGNGYSF